jgi:hypothetical protein
MATLTVTVILLVIVTILVLFSANVGFFEQKTTTNENRARISQQAAEYALNVAGEYLKANRAKILANDTAKGGWLPPSTAAHWVKCADVGAVLADFPDGHPCKSERNDTRRAQLYFWTKDGTKTGSQTLASDPSFAAMVPASVQVSNGMGGASAFAATANVRALLCRLDTSLTPAECKLTPTAGNRVALTLIADASLTNEDGATGSVKATWASYSAFVPSASVPLVASGFVKGLGNGQIVANSDSASNGSNVVASVWSPNNVSIDGSGGGGVGSFITCQFSEFTGQLTGNEMTMLDVKNNCPTATGNSPPCNCPKAPNPNLTSKEDWSGHGTGGGSTLHKGNDILDVAAAGETKCDPSVNTITNGCRTLPDITFFPGLNGAGVRMDNANDDTDDSIFEYIFNVDYEVVWDKKTDGTAGTNPDGATMQNCGTTGDQNCVAYAMTEQFAATALTDCSSLGSGSSGIYYVSGPCSSLAKQIGSPDSPAIVVINQGGNSIDLKKGLVMYGMLFLHSDNPKTNPVQVGGTNAQVYGALVVEGDIQMTGGFTIVYDSTASCANTNEIPSSAKFGLVPGSWLDAKTSF